MQRSEGRDGGKEKMEMGDREMERREGGWEEEGMGRGGMKEEGEMRGGGRRKREEGVRGGQGVRSKEIMKTGRKWSNNIIRKNEHAKTTNRSSQKRRKMKDVKMHCTFIMKVSRDTHYTSKSRQNISPATSQQCNATFAWPWRSHCQTLIFKHVFLFSCSFFSL